MDNRITGLGFMAFGALLTVFSPHLLILSTVAPISIGLHSIIGAFIFAMGGYFVVANPQPSVAKEPEREEY